MHNGKVLDISPVIKVQKTDDVVRVISEPSVANHETAEIKTVESGSVVIRTSYRGPQGPRGDTATFNDLLIPSLKTRFLNRLS